MKDWQFEQFATEVLKRGALAVLPQHLPDHWLKALLEEADILQEGDRHEHEDTCAGLLARIIHQPKKSTRENPFGGQMILTTLISQDHHAPKARSSDGLDSVQSGLSVVSRRTSSWQPPRADHHRFVRDPPEVSMALTGPATSDAPTLTTLHSALRLARLGTTRATKSGSVLEPLARGHPVSVSAIGSWPS